VSALILSLALSGCFLSNVGQIPSSEQSVPNIITKNTQSVEFCLNFSEFSPGYTVEGMNNVYTGLDIYADLIATVTNDGPKKVVVIVEGTNPRAYGSHPSAGSSIKNGCLGEGNGIAIQRNTFPQDDLYNFVFQFDVGIYVNYFSLNVLDFGDYDPEEITNHSIALVAYDKWGNVIDSYELSYDTDVNGINPEISGRGNDFGDACRSFEEEPGNHTFEVSGHGINKVVLEVEQGNGVDPYFGIRNICFTPTPELEVPVDIKPTSCPNPLNTKSQGVTPAAILGTADFDVTQVDPETVTLAGKYPLRWDWEDVATPFEPYTGKEDCDLDCNTEGPDGYLDLTLKFDTQALIAAMNTALGNIEVFEVSEEELNSLESGEIDQVTTTSGEVLNLNAGDCIVIQLEGLLVDGTPIIGEDVVRILKKGNK